MTLTVGIDVVEIERIRSAIAGAGDLLTDLLTPAEIRDCTSRRRSHARLAACFAVKEAFLKAAGTGLNSGLLFKDIEVVNQVSGASELRLSGRARELTGGADFAKCLVSSAFTDTLACAVVALYRKGIE
ncbi:MAG: holo-ACP synthase [candidate division Zixibacteria bacterium]|nr:holo-ACP synthase [candidate division Zixibacteria bacterium]